MCERLPYFGVSPTRSQGDVESWHTGLALAGMIPGVGAVPDLLDALLYAAEGRWGEAGDSVVSAAPIGGDLYRASTATRKVVGAARAAARAAKKAAVHGNSKQSAKPQHLYEIYRTDPGGVVKTDISGQPLNKNGTSPPGPTAR